MGTINQDKKSQNSQHARVDSERKSEKGAPRFGDESDKTAPVNRGKPGQQVSGSNSQTLSPKRIDNPIVEKMDDRSKANPKDEDEIEE